MIPTRVIQMSGDKLLPPSAVPLPPEGLPPETTWTVRPPVDPIFSEPTHFGFHGYGMTRQLAEAEWINEPPLRTPGFGRGEGVGIVPPPLWRITPRAKTLPDAWEGNSCYFLSRRLVEVLEEVAPDAIEKVPMRIEDRSGNLVSEDHFIVDVIRRYPAIDWANSLVVYTRYGDEPDIGASPRAVRMLPDLPDDLTVFRDAGRPNVYVRRDVKERLERLKPKFRGLELPGA